MENKKLQEDERTYLLRQTASRIVTAAVVQAGDSWNSVLWQLVW